MKIKKSINLISFGIILFLISSCQTKSEIHLLPKNFKGVVMIIYDQKDGEDVVTKDGSIIYKIPSSGILKTKNTFQEGLVQTRYFYDTKPEKTELKYYFNEDIIPNDTVAVFGGSSGTNGIGGPNPISVDTYMVGTKNDLDSLYRVMEKLNAFQFIDN